MEELDRLLKKKGYKLRGSSDTGKTVKKFEKQTISKELFDILMSNQIFRVIGFFLFRKEIISTDELMTKIKNSNLQYTIKEPILKKAVCPRCKEEIVFLSIDKTPNVRCQKCGREINKIEDEWRLKENEVFLRRAIFKYLNLLKDKNIISKSLDLYCPLCFKESKYFEETKIRNKDLKCENCGSVKEVKWIYTPPEEISHFWSKNGIWLEWYVKNILSSKGFSVFQGIKVIDNKNKETEIDCLLVRSGKIITISCKAVSFDNTYNEEVDILKFLPFSDYIILVTTTKISDSLKSRYVKVSPKCKKIFVDGYDIEKLPEIINKKIRI
jgi:ribosomal protein S27E